MHSFACSRIPDDCLGFKGQNVGFCQQLINFIDDKSIDGWTMSNIANTIVNSQPRISLKQQEQVTDVVIACCSQLWNSMHSQC